MMSYNVHVFFDKLFWWTILLLDHDFIKYNSVYIYIYIYSTRLSIVDRSFRIMVNIEWRERKTLLNRKEIVSLTRPACNHMVSTFVHSHFLFFFSLLYLRVIDTDRLLFSPVLVLTYERPLVFNPISAPVRLHSHRLHNHLASVFLLLFRLIRECVCVC